MKKWIKKLWNRLHGLDEKGWPLVPNFTKREINSLHAVAQHSPDPVSAAERELDFIEKVRSLQFRPSGGRVLHSRSNHGLFGEMD